MRFEEVASGEWRVANRRDVPPSSPRFFVSVASKELRVSVNPLDATLMGILVSVADKGLREMVLVGMLQDPVTPSGMSRKPNRDAKNAQTAHLQI
jgi:hypothetical protein